MNKPKGTLLIIDGNALIHRSFHALPPTLITKSGEMVNAVYGFSAALIKAVKEFKPDYVVLTMDKKGPTFRHEEYKEYKATRVKAPDELYAQFDRVKEVSAVFGIPLYELSGFEADDLIGTICKQVDSGLNKIILTGDMDTLQLVDDHTKVYAMSRGISDGVLYDEPAVIARYGLKPDQVIDYKALRGDPSDNIPGVKGIGEKTAVELLKEFGTLKNLYDNLDSAAIKDRIRELLRNQQAEAELSYRLATIHQTAPIEFDLAEASFGDFDRTKVVELFSELAFKSLLPRVQDLGKKGGKHQAETVIGIDKFERNRQAFKYELVDDDKKFKSFLKKIKEQKAFVFDTETDSLDPLTCRLLGISFSWKSEEAYFIKIESSGGNEKKSHDLFNYNEKTTGNTWLEELRSIFEDSKIKKYCHNAKFDLEVVSSQGVPVQGISFDTMIASYLLNPGSRQHNLDGLAFSELGFEKISKDDLLGTGRNRITFDQVPIERLANYSCEDADITWRLVKKIEPELKAHELAKLFKTMEMPLVPVLARMEELGISLDKDYLGKLGHKLHLKISSLEKKIYEQAGQEFNINSPLQLQEVLFEKLELSTHGVGKTKTGLSTAADELEKLRDQHEIVRLILEYRELAKLTSTYIDALPKLINPKTKRIHTSFNQTVAATGRLSSSDPNLQNIPVKGDWGQAVRKAFVASPGYKLVGLDYSQIELRLAAHFSGDKRMIKAFREKEDIHTATAAAINEVEPADVTKEMRREAKATNFGILYGQGPHGLSQAADIPFWRAKQFIDNYFEAYPGVKKWMDQAIEDSRATGFAETLFGRKRNLPEISSSVMQVRKAAERMAINTPLQGTAADMIKAAMIEIHELIRRKYQQGEVKMLLQVHDELLFEIKRDAIEDSVPELKRIMENVLQLKVPVIVEHKMGESWGELE
ncbi:DNA polymerase I [Candidatus Falkowbacteria bacterium]|nr:DNA polymerase I [Candidatus Falkowbacteria bacterium]